mmetsp:Transcript_127780/g.409161  ORF Transcript_127780/g.409161 Transcript_127780/m.409161 type:complete len:508 (-) Transcript_127780:73-1596(-)
MKTLTGKGHYHGIRIVSASVPQTPRIVMQTTRAPLSARQRKQVYNHSAIFDAGGAPAQSVYNVERQCSVLGDVRQQFQPPRGPASIIMPSARDLKATANAGHGIITWDAQVPVGRSVPDAKFVQFCEAGDYIRVVHSIPDRLDSRAARNSNASGAGVAPGERKRHDLCSDLLGGRGVVDAPPPLQSPRRVQSSEEIQSMQMLDFRALGSTIERSPGASQPMSARARRDKWLDTSSQNQLASPQKAPRIPGPSASESSLPGGENVERRRAERNYSDLFGSAFPVKSLSIRRVGEACSPSRARAGFGTADPTCMSPRRSLTRAGAPAASAGDEDAEVYRPHCSALMRSPLRGTPAAAAAEAEEQVLPMTPRMRRPEHDPEVKQNFDAQRACWDTKVIMVAGAELARLRRERHFQRSSSEQPEDRRSRTAGERKRHEFGSHGLRYSMGDLRPQREDGDATQRTRNAGLSRTMLSTGSSLGPLKGSARGSLRAPNSARERKLSNLVSSGIH